MHKLSQKKFEFVQCADSDRATIVDDLSAEEIMSDGIRARSVPKFCEAHGFS